jgi:two-component system chemotaxis response regulator CheY
MLKILIAEDDLVSRKFLNKMLSKYGECDLVVDGLEAIEAYMMALEEKKPYELICLDIMMPKLDGIKVIKVIRDLEIQNGIAEEQRAKIMMTTALSETEVVQTAFEYGCNAYASKPIDINKFIDVMGRLGLIIE